MVYTESKLNFHIFFFKDLTFLKVKADSAKGNKSLFFSLSILLLNQILHHGHQRL